MAFAGETIENPVTKERITFRATMRDTGGEYFQMETLLPPEGLLPPGMSTPTSKSGSRYLKAQPASASAPRSKTHQPGKR